MLIKRAAKPELAQAIDLIASYLAGRDHSEHELRGKLQRRFGVELIDQALQCANDRGWLLAPEKLAEKAEAELNRRGKSHRYIQGQLRKRGLPPPALDQETELAKLRRLVQARFSELHDGSREERRDGKIKAMRYLKFRGFNDALIRKVLNEKSDEE